MERQCYGTIRRRCSYQRGIIPGCHRLWHISEPIRFVLVLCALVLTIESWLSVDVPPSVDCCCPVCRYPWSFPISAVLHYERRQLRLPLFVDGQDRLFFRRLRESVFDRCGRFESRTIGIRPGLLPRCIDGYGCAIAVWKTNGDCRRYVPQVVDDRVQLRFEPSVYCSLYWFRSSGWQACRLSFEVRPLFVFFRAAIKCADVILSLAILVILLPTTVLNRLLCEMNRQLQYVRMGELSCPSTALTLIEADQRAPFSRLTLDQAKTSCTCASPKVIKSSGVCDYPCPNG